MKSKDFPCQSLLIDAHRLIPLFWTSAIAHPQVSPVRSHGDRVLRWRDIASAEDHWSRESLITTFQSCFKCSCVRAAATPFIHGLMAGDVQTLQSSSFTWAMPPPTAFEHLRQTALSKLDRSPKGSIDEPILPLLELVNAHPDWVSTSSCSGRIAVYAPPAYSTLDTHGEDTEADDTADGEASSSGKGGGTWLFVSHTALTHQQRDKPVKAIFSLSTLGHPLAVGPSDGPASPGTNPLVHLKYEPPVLHLASRSVETALPLLRASIAAGFRNSGLVVGTAGRVMLGVRSSPGGLDVPIAERRANSDGQAEFLLLVSEGYLRRVWLQADDLMQKNERRLGRLYDEYFKALRPVAPESVWEPDQERRERKRREGLAKQQALQEGSVAEDRKTNRRSAPVGPDLDDFVISGLSLEESAQE